MEQSNENEPQPQANSLNLGAIYFVLFRRKWLIAGFAVISAAIAVAAAILLNPSMYRSDAKLFVRYVLETKSISAAGSAAEVKSPDYGGQNIINSEIEILTSFDLAEQVAEKIGPDKILGGKGDPNERTKAADIIQKCLQVQVAKQSSVIHLGFSHENAELVQPVLNEIIDSYLKKHVEVHRAIGVFDDFLTQETDQLRSRLAQTEEELRKIKIRTGIVSLEDTRKAFTEQISKVRQELFNAEAELAQCQAAVAELGKIYPAETNDVVVKATIPSAKLSEYQLASARLEGLLKKQEELLVQFTAENAQVKENQQQITLAEQAKEKLEKENPSIESYKIDATVNATADNASAIVLSDETIRIAALEAKMKVLGAQLEKIRKEASTVDESEASIVELQRKKEAEEVQFRYYQSSLEQSRIDEALGLTKISNVSKIQSPTPPFKDVSKRKKIFAMILGGGTLLGIGLAFFLEMFLNRSVRTSSEIETKFGIPLLLSIPTSKTNGNGKHLRLAEKNGALNGANGESNGAEISSSPWISNQWIRSYCETLTDGVINYFDVKNLHHKPKLVAVTSCAKDAGVTTLAAGLAASLSETGDGNVLLVDMNVEGGVAHYFYQGKPMCGLDEILETGKRDEARMQSNLYVVTEGAKEGETVRQLPKRLGSLLPKLKASDYDYIIFDMPPVGEGISSPRLAEFMDMILFVVESGKTDRDAIKGALTSLGKSKTKVNVILNKTQTYTPRWLGQEA